MTNFGIGIYNPKFMENVGILWRSAYLLGASWIFTIGTKYKQAATDTQKTWKQIPLFQFESIEELWNVKDICVVGVETADIWPSTVQLPHFKHPKICGYLLGNESKGLPVDILRGCRHVVSIPAIKAQSYNVSMAGTLILYDRMCKKDFLKGKK